MSRQDELRNILKQEVSKYISVYDLINMCLVKKSARSLCDEEEVWKTVLLGHIQN